MISVTKLFNLPGREYTGREYRKGQDPHKRDAKEFLGDYPRRIYKAVPEKIWMNGEGKVNGNYIDIRVEVDLLNK